MGLLMRGIEAAARKFRSNDASPYVRIVAAEALGRYGSASRSGEGAHRSSLDLAPLDKNDVFVGLAALNALDNPWAPRSGR